MYDFEQFDYYELLGVPRTASADEIKRAYRQEIAQYHPDKWSNAATDEQEYARKRAAAITEAYSILKDKKARQEYVPATSEPAAASRAERLEQLYQRGRTLLAEGRAAEAATVLRQLQQADPFYRDSVDLLARAERAAKPAAATPPRRSSRKRLSPLLMGLGALLTVVVLVGAIWLLGGTKASSDTPTSVPVAVATEATTIAVGASPTPQATTVAEGVPIANPTAAPAPTDTSEPAVEPTAPPTATTAPAPTDTLEPTAAPTAAPTATAAPAPTDTIEPTVAPNAPSPVDDLSGPILVSDSLDGGSWPVGNSGSWSFDFVNGRYHMTMQPGVGTVWAYSGALPTNSVVLAVDVEPVAGAGGLLLGFVDGNNYYRFLLAVDGTWAFQQRSGGTLNLLASGGGLGPGRLVVAQRGALTHLYWNNTLLAEVSLPAFPSGSYGFVLAGTDYSEAYFDNLRIRALP